MLEHNRIVSVFHPVQAVWITLKTPTDWALYGVWVNRWSTCYA